MSKVKEFFSDVREGLGGFRIVSGEALDQLRDKLAQERARLAHLERDIAEAEAAAPEQRSRAATPAEKWRVDEHLSNLQLQLKSCRGATDMLAEMLRQQPE